MRLNEVRGSDVQILRCSQIKFFPRLSEHKSSFPEVLYRSSCLLINAVMKYLNFRSSGSKLHANLLIIALWYSYFSSNFSTSAAILKQRYWKRYLDGCFWGQFYVGNISERLLLKDSCKDLFILEIQRDL